MWSRIAKRTTTTDGCTKSKNTYNRHFKNNSFLGDKVLSSNEKNKKKKDFVCYFKQCVYICPHKTSKDNENNVSKYILVVAPVTTPTVVREQRSYVYTSLKI